LLIAIAIQAIGDYQRGPSPVEMRDYSKLTRYHRRKINARNEAYENAKRFIFQYDTTTNFSSFDFIMRYFKISPSLARKKILLTNSKQREIQTLSLDKR